LRLALDAEQLAPVPQQIAPDLERDAPGSLARAGVGARELDGLVELGELGAKQRLGVAPVSLRHRRHLGSHPLVRRPLRRAQLLRDGIVAEAFSSEFKSLARRQRRPRLLAADTRLALSFRPGTGHRGAGHFGRFERSGYALSSSLCHSRQSSATSLAPYTSSSRCRKALKIASFWRCVYARCRSRSRSVSRAESARHSARSMQFVSSH